MALKIMINDETIKEVKSVEEAKKYISREYMIEYETIEDLKTIEALNDEFIYLHEELGFALFKIVKNDSSETNVKTLKELKKEYNNNLEDIRDFEDLKALACNFIRMVTWKKVKDLDYISKAYYHVHGKIIHDVLKNGYDEALKTIKLDNLHKAYNINYLYEYYGLDYSSCKEEIKEIKLSIIG